MKFEIHQPRTELRLFVKHFWVLEGLMPNEGAPEDVVIPDGCLEMLFHYGDPFQLLTNSGWKTQEHSVFSGQLSTSIKLRPGRRAGIISTKFNVYGAHIFLQAPLKEYTDNLINCGHVFGRSGEILEELILEAEGTKGRIRLIEDFLMKKLVDGYEYNHSVSKMAELIVSTKGSRSLRSLREQIGIGERNLERHFQRQIGLGPKYLSKLVRLKTFIDTATETKSDNMTMLALDCGYYDQSHLIHDFQEIVGIKPSDYFGESHFLQ